VDYLNEYNFQMNRSKIQKSNPPWNRFDGRTVKPALCAGSLELKSRTGQILHSVAYSLQPLQHLRK